MPSYNRKRYQRKRKQFRRQWKKKARKTNVQRNIIRGTGMPRTFYMKMRYSTVQELSGSYNYQYYLRPSSIFDFGGTLAANTVYSHDQMGALYNRYQVKGVKLKYYIINNSANYTAQIFTCPSLNIAWAPTNDADRMDAKLARWTVLSPKDNHDHTGRIRMYIKSKNIFGQMSNDWDTSSVFGTNPTRSWYHHLHIRNPDQTNNVDITLYLQAVIYVKLFDLNQLVTA